jgi:hypothetical protein
MGCQINIATSSRIELKIERSSAPSLNRMKGIEGGSKGFLRLTGDSPKLEINFGVGVGLTRSTDHVIVKGIWGALLVERQEMTLWWRQNA